MVCVFRRSISGDERDFREKCDVAPRENPPYEPGKKGDAGNINLAFARKDTAAVQGAKCSSIVPARAS